MEDEGQHEESRQYCKEARQGATESPVCSLQKRRWLKTGVLASFDQYPGSK